MHTLYGSSISGNCWKPAFMLAQRQLPFRWLEVDIFEAQSRTPEFLAKNPNGRVPLLELPDGRMLAESNAMLVHFGEGTVWIPSDAYDRAKMFEWLFFEQYSHEPYIATVRFYKYLEARGASVTEKIAERTPGGYAALGVMEKQLAQTPFLVGAVPSLADVALFAYTHVAHEGLFDLSRFPAVQAWLARFAAVPGFVAMPYRG
ncbi:MAG TPA: glutathione S-transferase family protein [Kofleriaceae bacterium]